MRIARNLSALVMIAATASLSCSTLGKHVAQAGRSPSSESSDPLLIQAAQEFRDQVASLTVVLPHETAFFYWTNGIKQTQEVAKYIQEVTSDFGGHWESKNFAGPGLYLAQDPLTSYGAYGHWLVQLNLKKDTRLIFLRPINADAENSPVSLPINVTSGTKIREWLGAQGQSGRFDS